MGVCRESTMSGRREDDRLSEPGRLLSSFMRLVESVRLNCCVNSVAQLSERGCCGRAGTGFLRGTPLLPDIAAIVYATAGGEMRVRKKVCRCCRFGDGQDARARRVPLAQPLGTSTAHNQASESLTLLPDLNQPAHFTMLSASLTEECECFEVKYSELSHVVGETEKWLLLLE